MDIIHIQTFTLILQVLDKYSLYHLEKKKYADLIIFFSSFMFLNSELSLLEEIPSLSKMQLGKIYMYILNHIL